MPVTPKKPSKHQQALADFHEAGRKGLAPTSAGSIKPSRAITNIRRKISDLTESSSDIIRKAVTGGLVPEMEVWKGTDEEKQNILATDRSAKFEEIEVEEGMFVEVIIRYVPVSKSRVEIAKYILNMDASLKKAAEESKLRKIEAAVKQKKAVDGGALPKEDPVEAAKRHAAEVGPRLVLDYAPAEDDEEYSDDEDE